MRTPEETKREEAANAMLGALKLVRETVLREGDEAELDTLDAAIAQAEKAGIHA